MEDITEILAFEVKKEMADRYFGFRKRIEDDTAAYQKRIAYSIFELENTIGFGLIRLYILLGSESRVFSFISMTGLPEKLFYDSYFLESSTIRKRLFSGLKYSGITRKRGFNNMFFFLYEKLTEDIDNYCELVLNLTEEQETIREEINLFYRKNDIDSIMSFIRRLETPTPSVLDATKPAEAFSTDQTLSNKLRLHPPLPTCEILPSLPPLPPLKKLKAQLKPLLKTAFNEHTDLDLKKLTIDH